jgi:ribosomal protein S18 acetylase RimI-like enzyme
MEITGKMRLAEIRDIAAICKLMNLAYREKAGQSWTTEKDIVAGERITATQLLEQLQQQNFELWLLENLEYSPHLLGCIGLNFQGEHAEIGSFSVDPTMQNQGLGKELLNFAEQHVIADYPEINFFEMYVLSLRTELISFYERCGYQQTGHREDYPIHANVGMPLVDLHLLQMVKKT